ncbi:hypothetical protein, partial [Spirosoma spitsbergense]|uniref:hypothetical protein n=1 Tax=Spirosoma spitsbergense TaxID=431554 RepID=UPI000695C5BA
MKKNYVYPIQGISSLLLWACLLISQITGAQSIPDAQWARVGSSLAITNDGNIVTSEISLYNSYPGYGVTLGVARLVKYSLQGDQIWSTFGLSGGNFIGDKLPPGLGLNYAAISRISASAASADGGVLATGPVNFDVTGGSRNVAVRVGADGTGGGWKEEDVAIGNTPSDLIATSDGGFLLLYSKWQSNAPSPVVLRRYDAEKQVVWTKEISYPGSSSPDIGLTRGSRIINTPDGGYLLVGYFNEAGLDSPSFAWLAKLDGNGNVSWQRLLTNLPHNSQPNDIYVMNSITDVIISADGSGYTLVGLGVGLPFNKASAIAEIDFNGNPKPGRGKTIGPQGPKNFISAYTGSGGKKLYAVGTTEGTAPKILLIDPAGLNVLATRTFQGPGASSLIGIATAGDGSLVFATDNKQLVKLQPEATTQPPVGALTLIAPTYNCQTGAITFNTSGGDGTLIEYMAPGITGWTTNPNHILDACARTCADTPPFVISARQSGKLVTYTWSRQAYCANPMDIVRVSPIADMTVTVGQSVYFPIGGHFSSALTTNWSVGTSGLPPGITYFFRQEGSGSFIPTWVLLGTPTTAGVYSVTAFASANGGSASTTFQFIVTNANTSNPLTLTAPTYNCTTGAFTFNTSGGDGSPIEYMAPGITGWTTNPNQFVDEGSRTAL